MREQDDPQTMTELVERLGDAGDPERRVTIGEMVEAAGQCSFGVMLMVPGLLVLSPLSGIPGIPTFIAAMVTLISVQLLIGRHSFWLPNWLLKRSASRPKFNKAQHFMLKIARVVDKLSRRRLVFLASGPAVRVVALLCLAIAVTMPPLEILPFTSSLAGAVFSVLGLGLMARDGVMVLIALGFCAVLVFSVLRVLLF
ncbi:exopolysaccharide biosynthesis protein [Stutzerimonas tarimensis]|uniref:Exopolysaccharide biosynthesis protein n=1 Tax=Stutzerimonas tarimensis TaxID=1507735 RepID=A0ABV7SZS8_9GAMM